MKPATKPFLAMATLFGALLGFTPATAQETVRECDGEAATVVVTEAPASPVTGTEGDDIIVVDISETDDGVPAVFVIALGGDDVICVSGASGVVGGEGNDTIFVEGPPLDLRMTIEGGPGDDVIHGGSSKYDGTPGSFDNTSADSYLEFIDGGPGNDLIYGNGGFDTIWGFDGDDIIHGNAGIDIIYGGGGSDTIYGGWGHDELHGGDSPLDIDFPAPSTTNDAADTIYGGPGDDLVLGHLGADQLHGGPGDDILVSNTAQRIDSVDATTSVNALDNAGARMFGGIGDDLVVGSNRWDRMQGGPGNDTLWGFEGRDYIRGGPGNDQIIGGTGIDDMNGNTGSDHLVYDGLEAINGGWGIDRCEIATWPNAPEARSCERSGEPTLSYTATGRYTDEILPPVGEQVLATELRSGDCILGEEEPTRNVAVWRVDCAEPHHYEVYREALIAARITTFDRAAIEAYADDVCSTSLAAYVRNQSVRSELQFSFRIPTRTSWIDPVEPDRVVACFLSAANGGLLTGYAG